MLDDCAARAACRLGAPGHQPARPRHPGPAEAGPAARDGRAAAAVAAAAVVAAIVVGVIASLPGTGRPAGGRPVASPAASPGIVVHGWQPAGPAPAAGASPAVAPYIVIPGWGGDGTAQVRNIFAGRTIATIQPLPGQYVVGAAAAGDDRTFVLQAEMGGQQQEVNGRKVGPPRNATTVAFDELRLGSDGRPISLVSVLTVPARDALSGFAISQDASMLAYANTNNSGFETVSLATGTHRSWAPVDSGTVAPYSLSWAGDHTLAFEWSTGNNPHPPGIGLRVLDVARRATFCRPPGWSSRTASTARPAERARMASCSPRMGPRCWSPGWWRSARTTRTAWWNTPPAPGSAWRT